MFWEKSSSADVKITEKTVNWNNVLWEVAWASKRNCSVRFFSRFLTNFGEHVLLRRKEASSADDSLSDADFSFFLCHSGRCCDVLCRMNATKSWTTFFFIFRVNTFLLRHLYKSGRHYPNESRLWSEPFLGGPFGGKLTSDDVPKSLYQPMTMLDRSRSSNMIWATPMNTFLPSIRL